MLFRQGWLQQGYIRSEYHQGFFSLQHQGFREVVINQLDENIAMLNDTGWGLPDFSAKLMVVTWYPIDQPTVEGQLRVDVQVGVQLGQFVRQLGCKPCNHESQPGALHRRHVRVASCSIHGRSHLLINQCRCISLLLVGSVLWLMAGYLPVMARTSQGICEPVNQIFLMVAPMIPSDFAINDTFEWFLTRVIPYRKQYQAWLTINHDKPLRSIGFPLFIQLAVKMHHHWPVCTPFL